MGGKKVSKYPVIIEKIKNNCSAYSLDLPGCVTTGATIKETLSWMKDAIQPISKGSKKKD